MSLECLGDWPELERQARALFAEIADAQRSNSTLPLDCLCRSNAGFCLGRALLQQGRAKEAVPIFRDAARDSAEEYARFAPFPLPDGCTLWMRAEEAGALLASGDREQARIQLEKNLAAWDEIAATPDIPSDWRVKQAEVEYLLATMLDPSVPQEAQRRATLLERATTILESHAPDNPLSVPHSELLAKIKTLRAAESPTRHETASVTATSPALPESR